MNRNLSSKVGYRLKSNPLLYFGNQILAEIQGFEGHVSQPQTTKEMTMQPTATAKPATAAPAATSQPKIGAFGSLMSRIDKFLSSSAPMPTPEQLPTVAPVIPQAKSRDAYPRDLVGMLPAIPESRLSSLTTDVQRQQADGRANQTIPNIFKRFGELLVVEDETALSGEQAKLHALLSEFGWYLDGWTDASRTELR